VTQDGQVWVNNRLLDVDLESIDDLPLYSLLVDHRSYETHVETEDEGNARIVINGRPYQATLQSTPQPPVEATSQREAEGPEEISAPLPGWLVEIRVREGQAVEAGDVVAVLESMKMHMELRTSRPGVIRAILFNGHQEVSKGEPLLIIDPFEDEQQPGALDRNMDHHLPPED
jgi:biotin carboxyl carrier protein